VYTRRQPGNTALFQVIQKHLLTFEQHWTDEAGGRTLPKFERASSHGFNLQAAIRLAANDKNGRERLCRYILRPPLANDRLNVKRPWSDYEGPLLPLKLRRALASFPRALPSP
jgi:hypothetical protein